VVSSALGKPATGLMHAIYRKYYAGVEVAQASAAEGRIVATSFAMQKKEHSEAITWMNLFTTR
jgi:uncharacterized membrane protein